MTSVGALPDDLAAEQDSLMSLLDRADLTTWSKPTPAPSWTVLDQVAHLAFFDDLLTLSLDDPQGFAAERARSRERGTQYAGPPGPGRAAGQFR